MYTLLLIAFIGSVQNPTTAEAPTAQKAESKEERKICRRIDATESRLGAKRVCKTAAEWKKASDEGY